MVGGQMVGANSRGRANQTRSHPPDRGRLGDQWYGRRKAPQGKKYVTIMALKKNPTQRGRKKRVGEKPRKRSFVRRGGKMVSPGHSNALYFKKKFDVGERDYRVKWVLLGRQRQVSWV